MTASELINKCRREHIGFTQCPGCVTESLKAELAAKDRELERLKNKIRGLRLELKSAGGC